MNTKSTTAAENPEQAPVLVSSATGQRATHAGSAAFESGRLIDRQEASVLAGCSSDELDDLMEDCAFPRPVDLQVRRRVHQRWLRGHVLSWVATVAAGAVNPLDRRKSK